MSDLMTDNGYYRLDAVKDGSIFEGELKWDEWVEKYKPIKNHITKYPDPQSEYDMFETYGDEWEFVKSQDPKYVWTWVTGDMCDIVLAGPHFVNRFGYYVTEIPWDSEWDSCLLSVETECECYDEEKFDDGGDPDCKICEGYGLVTEYVG